MTIELGTTYSCLVTGFTGVAIGHVRYLTGCDQALLAPPVDAEGKWRDPQWFDAPRLAVTGTAPVLLANQVFG